MDTSFAGDGELTVKPASGPCGWGVALALRDDGRIVVGHTVETYCGILEDDGDGGSQFGVLSLQRDGSPDRSFSGDGQFARALGAEIFAGVDDVALLPDGGVAAAGRVGGRLGILRLTAAGAPKRGFGDRGGAILATGPVEPGGGMGGPARVLSRRGGGLLVIGNTALPGRRVYLAGVDLSGALTSASRRRGWRRSSSASRASPTSRWSTGVAPRSSPATATGRATAAGSRACGSVILT